MKNFARVRAIRRETAALFCAVVLIIGFVALTPVIASAGAVVIFFSGLCLGDSLTCNAGSNGYSAIRSQLGQGMDVIAPVLSGGRYTNNNEWENKVQPAISNASHTFVLVAYSAGHYALETTVNKMNPEQLKRVKSVVSLEANYPGFDRAVARVKSANQNVEVHRFSGSSCGTNHAGMPGSSCIAGKIASLAKSAHDGTPTSLADLKSPPSGPPPPFSAYRPLDGNTNLASLFQTSQPQTGQNTGLFSGYPPPYTQPYPEPMPQGLGTYLLTGSSLPTSTATSSLTASPKWLTDFTDRLSAREVAPVSDQLLKGYEVVSGNSWNTMPTSSEKGVSTFAKTNELAPRYHAPETTVDFSAAFADIVSRLKNILEALTALFK